MPTLDEKNNNLNLEQPPKPATEALPVPEPVPEQKESESKTEDTEPTADSHDIGRTKRRPLFVKTRAPAIIPNVRDEITLKVEKIMEADVGEAYARLSPVAQQEFKLKGEETARAITEILKGAHVKVKKIFQLILQWLKMLPGVNKFFLEQEAKIKTDRMIDLHKNKK